MWIIDNPSSWIYGKDTDISISKQVFHNMQEYY